MSKKKVTTHCLVIDASVARAAGTLESQHPIGSLSRNFLMGVRSVCHRMAWTSSIKTEWEKHGSSFSLQWLVSMVNLNKLHRVIDPSLVELRGEITSRASSKEVAAIMLKDCHLIEAAVATDCRVASLDDAVRCHFGNHVSSIPSLQSVIWVNPAAADERAVAWLEQGAPAEKKRRLRRK